MKNDFPDFRFFLSFRIGALSRNLARYFNRRFAEYNITIGQALVLFYLFHREGSPVKDIAEGLELDSPAVSRLIDRLIKEGLVSRTEDTTDRRTLRINLTRRGRELAERVMPISKGFNDLLIQRLGRENYSVFLNCLEQIKDTIK